MWRKYTQESVYNNFNILILQSEAPRPKVRSLPEWSIAIKQHKSLDT